MKETFLAFLGKTLNINPDRLAEILFKKSDDGTTLTEELNEGVLDTLVRLDVERVAKLKPDTKPFFDNGYKKAQSEVSEKWEKAIREKFGIADELTGDELLTAAVEKSTKAPKLDDDKVKSHPLFVQLERKAADDLRAAKEEGERALNDYKTGVERQTRLSSVQADARKILLGRKPVLSSDPVKQENQVNFFLQNLAGYDFEQMENGWLPMHDGKRVENAHGHPVTLEELVKNLSDQYFDFQVQDAKGNAGNGNPPGGNGGGARTASPFKNKAEFEDAYWKETDPAKRSEMAKQFSEASG
ncbi:MAG: hypothetical protein KDC70_00230 [Saprospiraceae bacterium]|nr:hypothetical protein [Saprospiraceae bacterium]